MKFNKKAIMLDFIVTVLLALIIFIPACLFTSELFRTSEQGRESFAKFTNELGTFAKGKEQQKSALLILDAETFIAVFADDTPVVFHSETTPARLGRTVNKEVEEAPAITRETYFRSPPPCTKFPCACLCREFEEQSVAGTTDVEYVCPKTACTVLKDFTITKNWGIQRSDTDESRRVIISLKKEGNKITLSQQ